MHSSIIHCVQPSHPLSILIVLWGSHHHHAARMCVHELEIKSNQIIMKILWFISTTVQYFCMFVLCCISLLRQSAQRKLRETGRKTTCLPWTGLKDCFIMEALSCLITVTVSSTTGSHTICQVETVTMWRVLTADVHSLLSLLRAWVSIACEYRAVFRILTLILPWMLLFFVIHEASHDPYITLWNKLLIVVHKEFTHSRLPTPGLHKHDVCSYRWLGRSELMWCHSRNREADILTCFHIL